MPKKKITKKHEFDKFYTKPDVAKLCYKLVEKFVTDELLIEPSAGNGAFFNLMRPPRLGYDLFPEAEGIISGSWFDQEVQVGTIVIGNPPFGNRNDLTKKFILHSIPNAKCIAFVLPMVFKKETMQRVFPSNWALVEEVDLPRDSFLVEGNDYHVPCVFQIWVNQEKYERAFDDHRESKKPIVETDDFSFTNDVSESDYFVFGAAPHKVIHKNCVAPTNRGYYIVSKVSDLPERFQSIDWKKHALSSVNGGVSWFSKKQVMTIYCMHFSE